MRTITIPCQRNYISARINRSFARILIDSGAAFSIMNYEYACQINAKFQPLCQGMPTKLFVANGQHINVKCMAEVELEIENVNIVCKSLIADELSVSASLVLGNDFLNLHKCILNFDENTLTLDETVVTSLSVQSETQDVLSLTDLTKLEPRKTTMAKVKTPARFTNKLLMVSPFKPWLRDGLIVERSIVQPDKYGVHIMLINISNDCIYLPKGTRIATGEIVNECDLTLISDMKPQRAYDAKSTLFFSDGQTSAQNYEHESHAKRTLNVHAEPFTPGSGKSDSTSPSRECKIQILENLGLNLHECKIEKENLELLIDLLFEFKEVFDIENPITEAIPNFSYEIQLKDDTPVWKRNFKVRADVNQELENHIEKLLAAGVIERTTSPYNSPILCLSKPGPNKATRFLLDCRGINEKIVSNFNYIHDAEYIIQKILQYRAKYYSKFDIKNAFFSLDLHPNSRHITAFSHPAYGQLQFCRLVQGLKSSPSVFCSLMNQIFGGMSEFLQIYLDDMLLCDKEERTHLEHIRLTLERVRQNNLRINASKTKLFVTQVNFIGYVINEQGWTTDPNKIKAILTLQPPKDVHELKSILGATSYYRKFCPSYSKTVIPLLKLLKKGAKFNFDDECKAAFQSLIDLFKNPLVLRPFQINQPVYLATDSSYTSIASILYQWCPQTKKLFIVDTACRSLKAPEKSYTVLEKLKFLL